MRVFGLDRLDLGDLYLIEIENREAEGSQLVGAVRIGYLVSDEVGRAVIERRRK